MIKVIQYPEKSTWQNLVKRPYQEKEDIEKIVKDILTDVKENRDTALIKYAKTFDKADLQSIVVSEQEVQEAKVSPALKKAIKLAYENIKNFHQKQSIKPEKIETTKGVFCWRKSIPIEKVGLYIPGGTAPLFSTVLMLGIPAKLAGSKEIILCSPPNSEGNIHPAILFTAKLIGIHKIFKVGGSQAIGAMTFGTESIPKVYKIFGPGNQFVTKAKELVQQEGLAIDMPAGPSEVLVIADKHANPVFVAADLLSQAEHGTDSQVILLSDNLEKLKEVNQELEKQVEVLPRKEIAKKALENSQSILLNSLEECMEWSNLYAPEHLIINTLESSSLIEKVINAGSVFMGKYACESAGDYASGTNHTLPTNAYARNYSGVSLDSFMKKVTFQEITAEGIQNIGGAIEIMAEAEELFAHKNAVTVRLKDLA